MAILRKNAASVESTNFCPCPLQFQYPRSEVPHLETDSRPRHKLQDDEPLRMLSFLRMTRTDLGGEIGRGIGMVRLLHRLIGYAASS